MCRCALGGETGGRSVAGLDLSGISLIFIFFVFGEVFLVAGLGLVVLVEMAPEPFREAVSGDFDLAVVALGSVADGHVLCAVVVATVLHGAENLLALVGRYPEGTGVVDVRLVGGRSVGGPAVGDGELGGLGLGLLGNRRRANE